MTVEQLKSYFTTPRINGVLRVLVACEESQTVAKAFRKLGHDAFSCDIIPCSGGHTEWHIQTDVTNILSLAWDIVIAHPPCTHLAVSGSRFFTVKREDGRQREAIEFFMKFMNISCLMVAVENPIGIISGKYIEQHFPDLVSKYGLPIKQTQIIQPYEFGDPVKKSTCLWLKGLPKLVGTLNVSDAVEYYTDSRGVKNCKWNTDQIELDGKKYGWGTPQFKKHRSKTFQGIADAMALQWSEYALARVNSF